MLTQQAVIERDESVRNELGAKVKTERKVVATIPCLFAPFEEESRSRTEEYATAARTVVEVSVRLMVLPGADVKERDWVKEVLNSKGTQLIAGPFRVVGVLPLEDHVELSLERP
jgi:hypothetical protein